MRVPWTARRSNQSILKEISPEYSLEKTLMLGKIEGEKRRGNRGLKWLEGITDSMDMSLSQLREMVKDREASVLRSMGSPRAGHNSNHVFIRCVTLGLPVNLSEPQSSHWQNGNISSYIMQGT